MTPSKSQRRRTGGIPEAGHTGYRLCIGRCVLPVCEVPFSPLTHSIGIGVSSFGCSKPLSLAPSRTGLYGCTGGATTTRSAADLQPHIFYLPASPTNLAPLPYRHPLAALPRDERPALPPHGDSARRLKRRQSTPAMLRDTSLEGNREREQQEPLRPKGTHNVNASLRCPPANQSPFRGEPNTHHRRQHVQQ